jgi:hypothetical protein
MENTINARHATKQSREMKKLNLNSGCNELSVRRWTVIWNGSLSKSTCAYNTPISMLLYFFLSPKPFCVHSWKVVMDRVHVTWYIVHLLSMVKWEQHDMTYFLFKFRTLNMKYGCRKKVFVRQRIRQRIKMARMSLINKVTMVKLKLSLCLTN